MDYKYSIALSPKGATATPCMVQATPYTVHASLPAVVWRRVERIFSCSLSHRHGPTT